MYTKTTSYKDLEVWKKALALSVRIYITTKNFPKEEMYGLVNQMRRSSISIPSNIAEGRMRGSRKEYTQLLRIAYGSGAELETQLLIAQQLPKLCKLNYSESNALLEEVMKMLNVMIRKLHSENPTKLKANEAIS